MSSTFEAESRHNLDGFLSSGIDLTDGSQFGTNKELGWTGIDIESDSGTAANGLTFLTTS